MVLVVVVLGRVAHRVKNTVKPTVPIPLVGRDARRGFEALRKCLLETGFNYSSEDNEGSSWFTESTHINPRISTIENWVEATQEDPMFVLEVPWLKTGMSVRQMVDRMFAIRGLHRNNGFSASDVARIVFNYRPPQPR